MSYRDIFADFEDISTDVETPPTSPGRPLRRLGPDLPVPTPTEVPLVATVPWWTRLEVTPEMQSLANAIHDNSVARRKMVGR